SVSSRGAASLGALSDGVAARSSPEPPSSAQALASSATPPETQLAKRSAHARNTRERAAGQSGDIVATLPEPRTERNSKLALRRPPSAPQLSPSSCPRRSC